MCTCMSCVQYMYAAHSSGLVRPLHIHHLPAVSGGRRPASTVAARLRALEKPEKAVQKVVVARELAAR